MAAKAVHSPAGADTRGALAHAGHAGDFTKAEAVQMMKDDGLALIRRHGGQRARQRRACAELLKVWRNRQVDRFLEAGDFRRSPACMRTPGHQPDVSRDASHPRLHGSRRIVGLTRAMHLQIDVLDKVQCETAIDCQGGEIPADHRQRARRRSPRTPRPLQPDIAASTGAARHRWLVAKLRSLARRRRFYAARSASRHGRRTGYCAARP